MLNYLDIGLAAIQHIGIMKFAKGSFERQTKKVHGQVNRTTATFACMGIKELRSSNQKLKIVTTSVDMPALRVDALQRNEVPIHLCVVTQKREYLYARYGT